MKTRPSTTTALVTVLAPISWGTTYVTVTELLPPDRPLFVAALRVLPAGLVLAAIGLGAGWRPRGRQWVHTAVLAFFNFGLFMPLLIAGVYRLPGGVAASAGGLQPLLVAVAAWLIRGEPLRRRDMAIGIVAAAGVALVVLRPGAGFDIAGILAVVGANVSFAVGVVLTKSFPAPEHRVGSTGWQLAMSAIVIVPLALVFEAAPDRLTVVNVAGLAYLGLLATGVAFVLWFRGVERLPTAAPPLLSLAAPTTGAALGWLLLGEDLTVLQLLGFATTISAIVYGATVGARLPEPRHRAAVQPACVTC